MVRYSVLDFPSDVEIYLFISKFSCGYHRSIIFNLLVVMRFEKSSLFIIAIV